MPERLNFAMLVEGRISLNVRNEFLGEVCEIFDNKLGEIREVMILDCASGAVKFASTKNDHRFYFGSAISDSELLILRYGEEGNACSVTIGETPERATFTISFPDMSLRSHAETVTTYMLALFEWALRRNAASAVLAGGEVEIDDEWDDAKDCVQGAMAESLAEWICCSRADLFDAGSEFAIVLKTTSAFLLRRKSPAAGIDPAIG